MSHPERPSGSPASAAAFFAERPGVTIRNTFLCVDAGYDDDVFPDTGFGRQISDPTTSYSPVLDPWVTEANYSPVVAPSSEASYLASVPTNRAAVPDMPPGSSSGAPPYSSYSFDAEAAVPATAWPSTSSASAVCGGTMVPAGQHPPRPRFCPNCGAQAEPMHRFCPFCCYQLQRSPGGGAAGGCGNGGSCASVEALAPTAAPSGGSQPREVPNPHGSAVGSVHTQHLLACLRRFRYVEADPEDVTYAHAVCMRHLLGGQAAMAGS